MAENNFISKLTIIIPCCNEEGNLARYETEFFSYFEGLPYKKEYIFVDDGSKDETWVRLEKIRNEKSDVVLIRHEKNKGLGAAIQSGIAKATGDAVLTIDADLTFHPKEFTRLLKVFSPEVACVTGSAVKGQFESVSIIRRFLSETVNLIYRFLLGKNITSTSSIFRLYRTSELRGLNLRAVSFDINAEIVAKLILKRKKVIEVPTTLQTRTWGSSKINVIREIKNHLLLFGKIFYWRITKSA